MKTFFPRVSLALFLNGGNYFLLAIANIRFEKGFGMSDGIVLNLENSVKKSSLRTNRRIISDVFRDQY